MHGALMPDLMVYVSAKCIDGNVCVQTILAPRMGSQMVGSALCPLPVVQRLAFGITWMSDHYNLVLMCNTVPAHLLKVMATRVLAGTLRMIGHANALTLLNE